MHSSTQLTQITKIMNSCNILQLDNQNKNYLHGLIPENCLFVLSLCQPTLLETITKQIRLHILHMFLFLTADLMLQLTMSVLVHKESHILSHQWHNLHSCCSHIVFVDCAVQCEYILLVFFICCSVKGKNKPFTLILTQHVLFLKHIGIKDFMWEELLTLGHSWHCQF